MDEMFIINHTNDLITLINIFEISKLEIPSIELIIILIKY